MDSRITSLSDYTNDWRREYRYGLYSHKLIAANGEAYTRPFIVVKNQYNVIVRFTTLHNYAGVFENKVFVPITSDAEAKLHYICKMLNYILIEHYAEFGIDHVFKVSREMVERFFRDYATERQPTGEFRGEQSVEKCVYAVTAFFRKLRRRFGGHVLMDDIDLVSYKTVHNKYGKPGKKTVPAFQVRGIPKRGGVFRELSTKAFKILLNLAFRYVPDIAFAICLQSFAGLRAGEVCNVRQEGSPIGAGLIFTRIEGRVTKIEIDLLRELSMRSDGVVCGRIKKERIQCVYPPFLEAFAAAYEHHKRFLSAHRFEQDFRPMFINSKGLAMTYDDYARRFRLLVDNRFRAELLECDDPELRIYGQICLPRLHEAIKAESAL